jgi:outer membrane lipoprotein-sorting protein
MTRHLRVVVVLVAVWVFVSTGSSALGAQDPLAVAVLSSSYQAMGGGVASTIQDTHATVQVTGTDDNGNSLQESVTIETAGQNMNMTNPTAGVVIVVNDDQMSITTESGTTLMSRLSLGNAGVVHLPLFSALADWSNPQVILDYVGLEQAGSTSVHHVRMQRPFSQNLGLGTYDQPCDFYIDAQSLLLIKLTYVQRAPSDLSVAIPVEVDYANYQLLAGVMVPMSVTYVVNGTDANPQTVTSFAVNQGTQPADFQLRH